MQVQGKGQRKGQRRGSRGNRNGRVGRRGGGGGGGGGAPTHSKRNQRDGMQVDHTGLDPSLCVPLTGSGSVSRPSRCRTSRPSYLSIDAPRLPTNGDFACGRPCSQLRRLRSLRLADCQCRTAEPLDHERDGGDGRPRVLCRRVISLVALGPCMPENNALFVCVMGVCSDVSMWSRPTWVIVNTNHHHHHHHHLRTMPRTHTGRKHRSRFVARTQVRVGVLCVQGRSDVCFVCVCKGDGGRSVQTLPRVSAHRGSK